MRKLYTVLILVIGSWFALMAQQPKLTINGRVADTVAKKGLPHALMMAVRYQDSALVGYTRSNAEGVFKPLSIPKDTFFIIVSHPQFSDQTYFLVPTEKDTAYTFGKIILPPKSVTLNEVLVIANKEKVYYKGDTLVFNADSFKTRANATVEDLLKKLPGVRVDAKGKITVEGKQVDQVLVDGDEFFGTDPTMATRNLNANTVETVQVFEKKSDNADSKDETVKVMNLKLKEDSKKGYFGKISAAGDYHPFYEGDILLNRFRKSQKISVFGLASNTPRQGFDWSDADKYGLNNEFPWGYDEENDTWTSNNDQGAGIPQVLKTGVYFNDKFGKNTKVNANYTYDNRLMDTYKETYTQFFFNDTTYSTRQINNGKRTNEGHRFNMKLTQKLDSLTELIIAPKINLSNGVNTTTQQDDFFASDNTFTRETYISNRSRNAVTEAGGKLTLNRDFKKKDRRLTVNYNINSVTDRANAYLKTDYLFKNSSLNSVLNQKRNMANDKMDHNAAVLYTEPLTLKIKLEVGYDFTHNYQDNNRKTYDSTSVATDIENPGQSNHFRNTRMVNRITSRFIYEVKKYKISLGTRLRQVDQSSFNVSTGQPLNLSIQNILPYGGLRYKFNQGTNLNFNYNTSAALPDVKQLQPVIDNTDPNRIYQGNPLLKPSFNNSFRLNFHTYKSISEQNFYANLNFDNTYNAITNTLVYDNDGKAISQPVNVNGNYNANAYIGGGTPVFKRFLQLYVNLNTSLNNNISFVNTQRNITRNIQNGVNVSLNKQEEKFDAALSVEYNYNIPSSSLSNTSNQPYDSYGLSAEFHVKLPKNFAIGSDASYTKNNQRAAGYNLSFVIWNASVSKTFLKTENLVVSLLAYDILNQNINNNRMVMDNRIIDTKTRVIRQYFLAKVLFKFNSQKTKEEDNDY